MPSPGKTAARGYGGRHKYERTKAARKVDAGSAFCWRCGEWIDPAEPWDLGHDDYDRTRYMGPEHRACNRATAGRRRRVSPVMGQRRRWKL